MWKHLKQIGCKAPGRNGRGATLIEVVIAIVVLGFLVASIPPAMVAVANSQFRQYELNIARDLTRSQFEYIKAQPYNPASETSSDLYDNLPQDIMPSGYGIYVSYDFINPDTRAHQSSPNMGITEVTIWIYGWRYDPNQSVYFILKSTDYKVDRSLQITWYGVNPLPTPTPGP